MNPLSLLTGLGTPQIAALAFALGCLLAGPAAYTLGRLPLHAELATQQAAFSLEKLRASERSTQVLQAAAARGDALSTTLLAGQARRDHLNRSRRDALPTSTTGGPCLGAAALRLLDGAPGLSVSGLPAAPGGAAATGGAVATHADDGGVFASDRDVTGWALDAGARYESCRERLDALIDWHLEKKTP